MRNWPQVPRSGMNFERASMALTEAALIVTIASDGCSGVVFVSSKSQSGNLIISLT